MGVTDVGVGAQPGPQYDASTPARRPSRARHALAELSRHPNLAVGSLLAALVVIVAIVGRIAAPYNPLAINAGRALLPPGASHWFGTDEFGRDVFSRVVYGTGIDLLIGLVVAALALVVGSVIGLISGYVGGWIDDIIMRIVDIVMSFPSFLLALSIAVVIGNTVRNVIIAVTIAYIPYILRLTRSSVLTVRGADYVLGARGGGAAVTRDGVARPAERGRPAVGPGDPHVGLGDPGRVGPEFPRGRDPAAVPRIGCPSCPGSLLHHQRPVVDICLSRGGDHPGGAGLQLPGRLRR